MPDLAKGLATIPHRGNMGANAMGVPVLLPMPRTLSLTGGTFCPTATRRSIQLDADMAADLLAAGRVIQNAAADSLAQNWSIVAGRAPTDETCVNVVIAPGAQQREQYTLDVLADHVTIKARSPAMAYYAAHTLAQLMRQFPQ